MARRGGGEDDHDTYSRYSITSSTSSGGRSVVSRSLKVLGVPDGMADVAAEMFHRGVEHARLKVVNLKRQVYARLTGLFFKQMRPPHTNFTIEIIGDHDGSAYCADVNPVHHDNGITVAIHQLHHVKRLIMGNFGATAKDLGNFTQRTSPPYSLILPLDTVIFLIRRSWKYVQFRRFRNRFSSYTIIKICSYDSNRTYLWVLWDDAGPRDRSRAAILTEREWQASPYRRKSVVLHVDDMELMEANEGRQLAFIQ